jgi:hypothetical protein
MEPLSREGQNLLDWLYGKLQRVTPGEISTYVGYGQALHELRLKKKFRQTDGQSLQEQGLNDLANWAYDNGLPGITGIIINVSKPPHRPGHGYFELYGKDEDDTEWWHAEVRRAKLYSWERFVTPSVAREVEEAARGRAEPTPQASDLAEPPERVETTTYRILRDTERARSLKALHKYLCQVCQVPMKLPDGTLYAEAHHIRPLGGEYDGPDIWPNMLCVCPNCHALLDLHAIELKLDQIYRAPGHVIGTEYVDHHNDIFRAKWATGSPAGGDR